MGAIPRHFQLDFHANASLSDGQKLQYLRSCLKGEAFNAINGLKICDANYIEAWGILINRYKVTRLLVDAHLRTIFAIEKTVKDSSTATKAIIDVIVQHVAALRALGRPVDICDDWLVHWTVSKLSYETRKQWELSLNNDLLPTFEELFAFLHSRVQSLELLDNSVSLSSPGPQQKPKIAAYRKSTSAFHGSTAPYKKCTFCNGNHAIYICTEFSKLTAS